MHGRKDTLRGTERKRKIILEIDFSENMPVSRRVPGNSAGDGEFT